MDRLPRRALLGLRRPRSGIFLGGFGLPLAVKCSGRRPAPGCAVIDPRKGGAESLASLEAKHGKLPATRTADTGGGGVHHLFRYPDFPVKNSTGELGAGLDIKGEGGAIVVAPSLHMSGNQYRWRNDAPIADAPG